MLKHPNYTFSVPDKRLYTLFKGITVTLRFVRASSVSSHGRASFTRGAFVSPSYDDLYTSGALTCGGAPLTRLGPPHAPHLQRLSDPQRRCSHGRPLRRPT
jgi:hypothetical protein